MFLNTYSHDTVKTDIDISATVILVENVKKVQKFSSKEKGRREKEKKNNDYIDCTLFIKEEILRRQPKPFVVHMLNK